MVPELLDGLRLVLFFTQGMSLKAWEQMGMFEREVAIYRKVQERGVEVGFVTYGDVSDLEFADRLQGIRILCNRWNLRPRVYEALLPFIHCMHLARADVIKTNQSSGSDIALRAARMWRKPLIARCGYMWSDFVAQDYGYDSSAARQAREVEDTVFSAAQCVVVTTADMQRDVQTRIPLAAEKTRIIPNYVETDRFRPYPGTKEPASIVFVGRLHPQKNVAALLEAVRPLDVQVAIIGDGPLASELHHRFGTLNGKVKWLGSAPNSNLPELMNSGTIYVQPSHYEGHPKTLIEAMACGLPVIGADSPGIRELIRHGENGYLCSTDSEGIRAAIKELLDQPELRETLGLNARAYVVENFSLDRILELEMSLLRGLVSQ